MIILITSKKVAIEYFLKDSMINILKITNVNSELIKEYVIGVLAKLGVPLISTKESLFRKT